MRIIFLLLFLILHLLAKKTIIKEMDDKFELINLEQNVNINKQTPIFDSSNERLKNNKLLLYEDGKKDLALIFSFDNNFTFIHNNFKIDSNIFSKDVFQKFIQSLRENSKFDLLNKQGNILHQTKSAYCTLTNCNQKILFDSSVFLEYEVMPQRMYEKKADFILFILLDKNNIIKDENSSISRAQVNIEYKIVDVKKDTIIENKNLEVTSILLDENETRDYETLVDELVTILDEFVKKSASKLKL